MDLERARALSAIVLTICSFSGLVLSGEIPAMLSALGTAGIAIAFVRAAGWVELFFLRLTVKAWNLLMLVALGALIIDGWWISRDLLAASVHFLVLLMVCKLLTLEQRKDFLQLYAISLLEVLATAALTGELWFGISLCAYLIAGIWAFLLYHLRTEAEDTYLASEPEPMPSDLTVTDRVLGITNLHAGLALCMTALIFVVMP